MSLNEPCSRTISCDNEADRIVPAPDGTDYPICESCYEQPCGRCGTTIENDDNVAKGLCQACRTEIQSWSADEQTNTRTIHEQQATLPTQ